MDLDEMRYFLRENKWDNDDILFLVQRYKEVFIVDLLRLDNCKKIVKHVR